MIIITSKSKQLIISKLNDATTHNPDEYTNEIINRIAFDIVLIKKYNKILSILNMTYLPYDLLNIIMDYTNDILILKCVISKRTEHMYAFFIKAIDVVINFEKYTFGFTKIFNVSDAGVCNYLSCSLVDNIACLKICNLLCKENFIGVFNKYMYQYHGEYNYIDIPCDKVDILPKIYDHKKMKNMIVITKLLLYTLLNK